MSLFNSLSPPSPPTKGARVSSLTSLTEDELEDVVKDKVLALAIAGQLEGLAEVHGALLLVDLERVVSPQKRRQTIVMYRTRRAPVMRMMIPPSPLEGWASRVETWCLTFSKGRDWFVRSQQGPC